MVRGYGPQGAHYLGNHTGHLMFVRDDERQFLTGEMIRRVTWTAPEPELIDRVAAIQAAGFSQIVFSILPGQEQAVEDREDSRRLRLRTAPNSSAGSRDRETCSPATPSTACGARRGYRTAQHHGRHVGPRLLVDRPCHPLPILVARHRGSTGRSAPRSSGCCSCPPSPSPPARANRADRRVDEGRTQPPVMEDGPARPCPADRWRGARRRVPVHLLDLHVHAHLLQQLVGHLAERRDGRHVRGVQYHYLLPRIARRLQCLARGGHVAGSCPARRIPRHTSCRREQRAARLPDVAVTTGDTRSCTLLDSCRCARPGGSPGW